MATKTWDAFGADDTIGRLRCRILDLERENAELRAQRDESTRLMVAGVEARDRAMLELICNGRLK